VTWVPSVLVRKGRAGIGPLSLGEHSQMLPFLKNGFVSRCLHLWSFYLGDWDWEDHSSRPACADSLRNPISNNNQRKWTADAQVVERLLCKQSPEFKLQFYQKKKKCFCRLGTMTHIYKPDYLGGRD
jgi:hypothetical protein